MEKRKLLEFIFKIKVIFDDKTERVIGTAFIINNQYAITAEHVVEKCKSGTMVLESYDGKHIIKECLVVCQLKIEEREIDIAVIKYQYNNKFYNELLELSYNEVELNDDYETYGYPKYNNFNEYYISGRIISPEGRMSIVNSTGEYKYRTLYSSVSGAPLIIDNTIRGVIICETVASNISKPELNACYFNNVIRYLETNNDTCVRDKKLLDILNKFCKKTEVKVKEKIDPFHELYDREYKNIKNKKNLSEKVLSKYPNFSKRVLNSWNRKCVQVRIELERISSEEKKAILMVVFYACVDFIEEEISTNDVSNPQELIENINKLYERTIKYVQERMKDYSYGIDNMIMFQNTIFDLIDSCFLAFDCYEEENSDVLQ